MFKINYANKARLSLYIYIYIYIYKHIYTDTQGGPVCKYCHISMKSFILNDNARKMLLGKHYNSMSLMFTWQFTQKLCSHLFTKHDPLNRRKYQILPKEKKKTTK